MKNFLIVLLCGLSLTSCNLSVSHSSTNTETTTEMPTEESGNEPVASKIVVNVPKKGTDWVDHKMNVYGEKLLLSTPKGVEVVADDDGIFVLLDEQQFMAIHDEAIDVPETKERYMGKSSRKDLQWLIDTETEALYTGLDLGAPEGHQTTNSFFATKKIGNKEYSTIVDGITIDDEDVYNLSPENCQLLLGIFRTLRAQ